MSSTTDLRYEVFVSDMVPVGTPPRPDDGSSLWSPLSHALIYGKNEALLTDPPVIREQADALIKWVESHDVALRYIYLTHAHFDHFATTNYLLRRFPDVTAVVSDAVLARIAAGTPGGVFPDLITNIFGEALPEPPVTVQGSVFPVGGLLLDGHGLFAHEVGHSDGDDTTVLHVPSLDLVIAGDVVSQGPATRRSRIGHRRNTALSRRRRGRPRTVHEPRRFLPRDEAALPRAGEPVGDLAQRPSTVRQLTADTGRSMAGTTTDGVFPDHGTAAGDQGSPLTQ
jgi:glyoxylase-like metal-dependent hydrolase (beta-lactamase superfamily II)